MIECGSVIWIVKRLKCEKNYKLGNVWAQKLARGQVPPLICETVYTGQCKHTNRDLTAGNCWDFYSTLLFIHDSSCFGVTGKQETRKKKLYNFNTKASQPSFVKKRTATRRPRNTAQTSGRTFKAGIGYKTESQVNCTISYIWIRFAFAVSSANIHCVWCF